MRFVPFILLGVGMNALGQLFLKQAVLDTGAIGSSSGIGSTASKLATAPWLWCGLVSYALSFVIWLVVLSRVDVSYAFPFFSVGYVVVAIAGRVVFDEVISASRMVGITIICLGVVVLAAGSPN
jgi:multidrug transporter EmrE-like cation transporter